MDQGSLAPLPHLADEETDSAAVSALLMGDGAGLCRTRMDGAEFQPGGRCCHTCHKQREAVDRQPAWGQDT